MRAGADTRVGSATPKIDQAMGGGLSGGSAGLAGRATANSRTGRAASDAIPTLSVGDAAAEAVHALRQAAMFELPSGQHGQGFGSPALGIESAHGISTAAEDAPRSMVPADKGADSNACPATST